MSVYNLPEFLRKLMESGLEHFGVYYGIYRAEVKDNADPKNLGRLKILCSTIHGDSTCENWAWPISPWASKECGMWVIPDVGDFVYVVFDHGRADQPLWLGGWWGKNDLSTDMTRKKVVLTTKEGMKVVMDRDAKTVLVEQAEGNSVFLSNDAIAMNHTTKVTMEAPELDITANVKIQGKTEMTGDVKVTGNGDVQGNWYALNNSAHHTHPVVNGVAVRNEP